MSGYDYDLYVIGGGSAGVRMARMSATYGAKVALAEERFLGGTCVNVGCVPKKLMVFASHFRQDFDDAAGYGWEVGARTFDWPRLIANKDKEIARLNGIYAKLLAEASVTLHEGRAVLLDPHSVSVNGKRYTAERIVVAAGGRPIRPAEPGNELGYVSDDLFCLPEMPKKVLMAGGGYISVEFAGIFNGLGADTALIHRGPKLLRGFDDDLRDFLGEVVYAIGRAANTEGLGLEEAGVTLAPNGAVPVDSFSRTAVPSIFALGDLTDRVQLTPVAIAEAMALSRTLYLGEPTPMDHSNIPSAVFSQPPIASVGLTEAEARETLGALDIYRSSFRPLRYSLTGNREQTLMKLVVERASQRVVGVHMAGIDTPEMLQGIAVAIKAGANKRHFDATVGIHPTSAEEFVTMRKPLPEPKPQAAE
ncbi:MAG: FAD-dependent oxidoreductase [Rhodospirillales bacterium]|nr:FAD-dependent oxidoreductase [Rhodospirillales bacterium]